MKRYVISSRGRALVEVQANSWLTALGLGLEHYGLVDTIERLACEALPNGSTIARDIRSGEGFVVHPADGEVEGAEAGPRLPDASTPTVSQEPPVHRSELGRIRDAPTRGRACQAALVLARRAAPAETGAIILAEGEALRFFAAAGPAAHRLLGATLAADTGIAALCMQTRRTIVLEDAEADPRHIGDVDRLTGEVSHAVACVPVVHDDRVFGVIEMINLPEGESFDRRSVDRLTAVAAALGERLERHRAQAITG